MKKFLSLPFGCMVLIYAIEPKIREMIISSGLNTCNNKGTVTNPIAIIMAVIFLPQITGRVFIPSALSCRISFISLALKDRVKQTSIATTNLGGNSVIVSPESISPAISNVSDADAITNVARNGNLFNLAGGEE